MYQLTLFVLYRKEVNGQKLLNLRLILNVKDFGAVGDGVTDDPRSYASWPLMEPRTRWRGKLYFPGGHYLVKKMVQLKEAISIPFVHDDATIVNGIASKDVFNRIYDRTFHYWRKAKIFWEANRKY